MPQYGMVIDLQKCVGCGACAIACKTENNTPNRANGQTFNWADFMHKTEGTFPNIKYTVLPVLCNHCSDAACIEVCPETPKSIYKDENGLTMTNNERCVGCQSCQDACPYSSLDVKEDKAEYSVISFNESAPHENYRDRKELIANCTASGAEIAGGVGATPPYHTQYTHSDYKSVRRTEVIEKCTFCAHRVAVDEKPYCVEACPAGARIFGDLKDAASDASAALKKYPSFVLKPEAGTKPNVHYIRSFSS